MATDTTVRDASSRLFDVEDIRVEPPTLGGRLRQATAYLRDMAGELWKRQTGLLRRAHRVGHGPGCHIC